MIIENALVKFGVLGNYRVIDFKGSSYDTSNN